jgi:prevent-host-death family protein
MARVPAIVPVSDLRQGAAAVLGRVRKTRQPIIITQRGRAAAVLVSIHAYEKSERDLDILKRIIRAEKELRAGKGTTSPTSWLRPTSCSRGESPFHHVGPLWATARRVRGLALRKRSSQRFWPSGK